MPTYSQNITSLPDKGIVDIWQVPLTSLPTDKLSLIETLDTDERHRHERFHKKLKQSYLISHVACRQILAQYLNISAKEIQYKKNPYGKPLLDHDTSIRFNMSHSNTLAIVAVSIHNDLGVDLEFSDKKTAWKKIAKRFFHPTEIKHMLKQGEDEQKKTFFQIWTRKEAYIKALGTGFATPFPSFNVIDRQILTIDSPNETEITWHIKDLSINPDYTASVVQNTSIEKIRYYSY